VRGYVRAVRVTANGDLVELAEGATVDDLLAHLDLGRRWVLVERNGEPVNRRDTTTTRLVDGDRLELVRAVAGG
jgi:sulfur carrier protein